MYPPIYNVWLVELELNQMAGYLKVLRTSLNDYEQKLADAPDPGDVITDDEANDRFNAWYDELANVMGDFPDRLYSAFIVSWYSFIEETLIKLCDDQSFTDQYDLNPAKKQGKGIWRARDILQTCGNYKFDPELWRELTFLNQIRNQIVHNGGKFACSLEKSPEHTRFVLISQDGADRYVYIEKNLYKYLKKYDLMAFYNTFFIKPSPEYCEHLVAFGTALFDNVFKGLGLK